MSTIQTLKQDLMKNLSKEDFFTVIPSVVSVKVSLAILLLFLCVDTCFVKSALRGSSTNTRNLTQLTNWFHVHFVESVSTHMLFSPFLNSNIGRKGYTRQLSWNALTDVGTKETHWKWISIKFSSVPNAELNARTNPVKLLCQPAKWRSVICKIALFYLSPARDVSSQWRLLNWKITTANKNCPKL